MEKIDYLLTECGDGESKREAGIANQDVKPVYWQHNQQYPKTEQNSQDTVVWSVQQPMYKQLTYISDGVSSDGPVAYVLGHVEEIGQGVNMSQNEILVIHNLQGVENQESNFLVVDDGIAYQENNLINIDKCEKSSTVLQVVTKSEDGEMSQKIKKELSDVSVTDDLLPLPVKKKTRKQTKKKRTKKSKTKKVVIEDKKEMKIDKIEVDEDEDEDKEIVIEECEGEKIKSTDELTKLEDNPAQVKERFSVGCECLDHNCFDGLNAEKVFRHRLNIADLTKSEHDMYLMGVVMATMQNPDETCRHKERVRIRSTYVYQGKKVCLTAFLYLEHVTTYQLKRIRKHLLLHGVSPRIHGNHGRKPANTLSLTIYQQATQFVQQFIEKKSVKLVQNFTTLATKNDPTTGKKMKTVKIPNRMTSYHLPYDCCKRTVHEEYKKYTEKNSSKCMKYSTFTTFMKKQFPNVKFQKYDKKNETLVNSCEQAGVDVKKRQVQAAGVQNTTPVVHVLNDSQLYLHDFTTNRQQMFTISNN